MEIYMISTYGKKELKCIGLELQTLLRVLLRYLNSELSYSDLTIIMNSDQIMFG